MSADFYYGVLTGAGAAVAVYFIVIAVLLWPRRDDEPVAPTNRWWLP